ncbi:hypothetical protein B9007_007080, partial [Klebsiella pneumoniae]
MQNNTNRIFIKNVNVRCSLIAACHSCLKNRLNVGCLMRWSLPPSRYYAEDRLSFGELSWK